MSTSQLLDPKTYEIHAKGCHFSLETGKIARQADGSVMLNCGKTSILATACSKQAPSEETDFLPLAVFYQTKLSANGMIAGGYIKRDGRPTKPDTLTSRLIDRPLRPLFPKGYYNEVQVIATLFSYEDGAPPEPLAICASSAALVISSIPFYKPVGAVRVGRIDKEWIINPSAEQMEESTLDLLLAGTEEAILMIEGYCDFLTEEEVLEAIEYGHETIQEICRGINEWANIVGKEKDTSDIVKVPEELIREMHSLVDADLKAAFQLVDKAAREEATAVISERMTKHFLEVEEPKYSSRDVKMTFKSISSNVLRQKYLTTKVRADSRSPEDIRQIAIELGLLPGTHGSALFTRGETQALSVTTLASVSAVQRYETIRGEGEDKFYLHYTFPPYSVGECGRLGTPGRREIGHGTLAERSLKPAMPTDSAFPYVVKNESNITESNGSSSMASVCGGSLSLMDAGVPLKAAIAGIAMGLILEDKSFLILSDILGLEDALGDMDFKIAGSMDAITAFQMDIKVEGITVNIMKAALAQAKQGRQHILRKMNEALSAPREDVAAHAPRIVSMSIKPKNIGTLIGPGGKNIKAIMEETGVEINVDDSGLVSISGYSKESIEAAKGRVIFSAGDVEKGKTYEGIIDGLADFGAFCKIPGGSGLIHISQIAEERVEKVDDHLKVGDVVRVKVLDIKMGKTSLSLIEADK